MSSNRFVLFVSNEKPFTHRSHNDVEFSADRCDFIGGVTVRIPEGTSQQDLMSDVAEMIGYHAMAIREHLTEGFSGYDSIEFKVDGCKRAKQLFNTLTGCGNDITLESGQWLRNHFLFCDDCYKRFAERTEGV